MSLPWPGVPLVPISRLQTVQVTKELKDKGKLESLWNSIVKGDVKQRLIFHGRQAEILGYSLVLLFSPGLMPSPMGSPVRETGEVCLL